MHLGLPDLLLLIISLFLLLRLILPRKLYQFRYPICNQEGRIVLDQPNLCMSLNNVVHSNAPYHVYSHQDTFLYQTSNHDRCIYDHSDRNPCIPKYTPCCIRENHRCCPYNHYIYQSIPHTSLAFLAGELFVLGDTMFVSHLLHRHLHL